MSLDVRFLPVNNLGVMISYFLAQQSKADYFNF